MLSTCRYARLTSYQRKNQFRARYGSAVSNTAAIVLALGNGDYAAELCNDLEVTKDSVKYDDWFLPSKDELDLMYDNLKASTPSLGGFNNFSNYWSSSEFNLDDAWYEYFGSGYQNHTTKDDPNLSNKRVRAVQAF